MIDPTQENSGTPASADAIETRPDLWLDRYGDVLFRDALVRLGDRSLASDAVQDALLAAIRGVREGRYTGRSQFKSWLRTIVRNKAIDQMRRRARETQFDTSDSEGIGESLLFKLAGIPTVSPDTWSFDVENAFEREEFWGAFEGCMTQLSDAQRSAFTLKVLDAVPTEVACKILNVTAANVSVLLHRARQALKSCLESKWFIKD